MNFHMFDFHSDWLLTLSLARVEHEPRNVESNPFEKYFHRQGQLNRAY